MYRNDIPYNLMWIREVCSKLLERCPNFDREHAICLEVLTSLVLGISKDPLLVHSCDKCENQRDLHKYEQ